MQIFFFFFLRKRFVKRDLAKYKLNSTLIMAEHLCVTVSKGLDKIGYQVNTFLISPGKHMITKQRESAN